MSNDVSIQVEGERGLRMALDSHFDASVRASRKAMQRTGLRIVADAKDNLKNNGSVVTGMLRATGKVQKVEGNPDEVDAGFFGKDSKSGYAAAVEYGRRAGKMPPIDALFAWLKKRNSRRGVKSALQSFVIHKNATARKHKNRTADDFLMMAARALAIHIGKHGTRPHPFFGPALQKNERTFEEEVEKAMMEEIVNGK